MIDEQTITQAVNLLISAAPGSIVILFGSCARGQIGPDSDLDFLVVEPRVKDRYGEMIRLRKVLRPLKVPADVLVVSAKVFEEWRDTPNTVIYEAAKEGRFYDKVA
ncbi:MAG: nucleotidyltransferase domain-containing protein [Phycisphaerae bacterium]|nr:nucleotidyltransferase domain-containing protein [Phycisphaerae bacterium]